MRESRGRGVIFDDVRIGQRFALGVTGVLAL